MKSLFKPKSLVISTIQRGAPVTTKNKLGQTVTRPGNLIINGMWFSSVEWRNQLLGAELPLELPVYMFIGCTINFDELELTEDILKKNGGKWVEVIRGKEVTFTKAGINRNNLSIDLRTLNISPKDMMAIKKDFPTQRADQRRPAATRPAPVPETIEEIEEVDETTDNGGETSSTTVDTPTEHVDLNEE